MSYIVRIQCDDGAQIPVRGSVGAAGYDLCAYITAPLTIAPGQRVLISTGLRMAITRGRYGRIAPRSGLALRSGIDVMAGVIDSDYRGTIGVILVNHGDQPFEVNNGDRIAQIIIETCDSVAFVVDTNLESTVRGAGGYGSTGTA